MFEVGLGHYLTLGAVIFTIGIAGIFLIISPITIAGTLNSQIEILNLEYIAFCMVLISSAEVCVSIFRPKKRKIIN